MDVIFVRKEQVVQCIDRYKLDNPVTYAYSVFSSSDIEIIYVMDHEKLAGVISIGDVFQYLEKKKSCVINKAFTKVKQGDFDLAWDFLRCHPTIHELPVVDENDDFVGVYRVETANNCRADLKTYLDELYYNKADWVRREINQFLTQCEGSIFGFQLPVEQNVLRYMEKDDIEVIYARKGKSAFETLNSLEENALKQYWGAVYKKGINDSFIKEFNSIEPIYKDGVLSFCDMDGSYFTFRNGHRKNKLSEKKNKKIYLVGPCTILGAYVSDNQTIDYYLQKMLGEMSDYEVINLGKCGPGQEIMTLKTTEIGRNDIVVVAYSGDVEGNIWTEQLAQRNVFWGDWSDIFKEITNPLECILDTFRHVNYRVNQLFARRIFENLNDVLLSDGASKDDRRKKCQSYYISWDVYKEVKRLAAKYEPMENVGAIVMNCNPFTLGHRYLIECALEHVDQLLLFVVEEDKSFFKFSDRFRMVVEGTADLADRVKVIPSGRYILSKDTFAQYFEKEKVIHEVMNMDYDIRIFAEIVCKEFGIHTRFAGEEPTDIVTCKYNEAMQKLLPEYGIQFVEIPRRTNDKGNVISATTVRQMLQSHQYDELRDYLPDSTIRILQEIYVVDMEDVCQKYQS